MIKLKKVRWAKNLKSYHYYNKNNSTVIILIIQII